MNLVLGNISVQEREERVSVGHSGSDVTGLSGGGGKGGDGLGGIVLGEFRTEVDGECESRELRYGFDAVISGLRRGSCKSQMRFEGEHG